MNNMFNRFAEYPQRHINVTSLASDTVDLPHRGMIIYCGTAGAIAVQDMSGAAITYTVTAGAFVPVLVKRVLSTGTTVTQIIGLI